MVLGMLPMSLGLGEGGEQNAPLGRAVIGGLLVATLDLRLEARQQSLSHPRSDQVEAA
jgi:Cu/Ag efflux pump CusA